MFNINIQCYQNMSQVLLMSAFILWPPCMCGFGIREKNPMRFAVFWRISVWFSDPLTPPSTIQSVTMTLCQLQFMIENQ